MIARTTLFAVLIVSAAIAAGATQDDTERPAGWLGVLLGKQAPEVEGDLARPGVRIIGVVKDGPAERAGFRAQDRIVAVDGMRVGTSRELIAAVAAAEPGRWVSFTAWRNGHERQLDARLVARPRRTADLDVKRAWLGVSAIDLPPSLRRHFGAPEEAGVMVAEIEPGSPAEVAGFEVGDVIHRFGEESVDSVPALRLAVSRGGVGNRVETVVARRGAEIVLEALLVEAPESERPR